MPRRFDTDTDSPSAEDMTVAASVPADTLAAPAAVTKTVEVWAAERGMLPQFFDPPVRTLPAAVQASGAVSVPIAMGTLTGRRPNEEFWKFAAARAMHRWPEGRELTEAEFDAAITAATTVQAR